MRGAKAGFARFEDCIFEDSRLDGWLATNAEFVRCTFVGKLTDAVFFGRPDLIGRWLSRRRINEFAGNDFEQASVWNVDFRYGVALELQRLPADPDLVVIPDAVARADRLQRAAAVGGARERLVAGLLADLMRFGRDAGDAMLYRRTTLAWVGRDVEDRALAVAGAIPVRAWTLMGSP